MKHIDFTKTGGFPLEQNTVNFMQDSYGEFFNAMIAQWGCTPDKSYIITGCEYNGTTITKGWVVINNEIMPFAGGEGDSIGIDTQNEAVTFENGQSNEVYKTKTAIIDPTGILIDDFIHLKKIVDLLDGIPDATVNDKGAVQLATTPEVIAGTNAQKVITPKTLKEAEFLRKPDLKDASTSQKGIVELADDTETKAGTSDTLAVSPKGLASLGIMQVIAQGTIQLGDVVGLPTNTILTTTGFSSARIKENTGSDSIVLVTGNFGGANYQPIITLVSIGANWDSDNDVITTVRNLTSSSFEILFRELSGAQNLKALITLIKL